MVYYPWMKKYFQDFVFGSIISFLFLVLPGFFTDAWGLPGADLVSRTFPNLGTGKAIILIIVSYVLLGLIPFSIYASTPFYKKKHPTINLRTLFLSFLSFSFGLILLFALLIVVALMSFTFSPSIS